MSKPGFNIVHVLHIEEREGYGISHKTWGTLIKAKLLQRAKFLAQFGSKYPFPWLSFTYKWRWTSCLEIQPSVLQCKWSSLQRNGSLTERIVIISELASSPFLRTMSITSRALSALSLSLAASASASVITLRCRSSSSSVSRTGLDTLPINCDRAFCSFSSAEVLFVVIGWVLSGEVFEDKAGK